MPHAPKPLPAQTVRTLVPPTPNHRWFEDFRDAPFRPDSLAYSLAKAWWLAEASHLVYGDEAHVRRQVDEAGLTDALGLRLQFIHGASRGGHCVVFQAEEAVVVAFRGTRIESFPDPLLNLPLRRLNAVDLATDVDLRLDPETHVHLGFRRAFDELWPALRDHLDTTRTGRTEPALWLTGHSLGAALATIAAEKLGPERVAGLYTFGSPRVGDEVFRSRFTVPCYRFVNNTDIVTQLPPPKVTGDYAHVGALRFLDSSGRVVTDPTVLEQVQSQVLRHVESIQAALRAYHPARLLDAGRAVADALGQRDLAWLVKQLEALDLDFVPVAAIADHAPIYYALKVWNAQVADDASGGPKTHENEHFV